MDELSFKAGELIMLKTRYGDDWFRGQLINGSQGIFPKNFVEVVVSVCVYCDRVVNIQVPKWKAWHSSNES